VISLKFNEIGEREEGIEKSLAVLSEQVTSSQSQEKERKEDVQNIKERMATMEKEIETLKVP
jgi:peptidoglycan hydrolase CwlO-like protein